MGLAEEMREMIGGDGLLWQSDLAFPCADTVTVGRRLVLISARTGYTGEFAGPTQVFPLAQLLTLVSFPVTRGSIIWVAPKLVSTQTANGGGEGQPLAA